MLSTPSQEDSTLKSSTRIEKWGSSRRRPFVDLASMFGAHRHDLPQSATALAWPAISGLTFVFFVSFFINLLALTLPLYMVQIYDRVVPTRHLETLIYLTLIATAAIAVYAILDYVRTRTLIQIGAWIAARLGPEILTACLRAKACGLDVGAKPLDQIEALQSALTRPAIAALFDVPWLPVFLVAIWIIHPALGMAAIAAALTLISIAIATDFMTRAQLRHARLGAAEAQRFAQATINNATSIMAMAMPPAVIRYWSARSEESRSDNISAAARIAGLGAASKGLRLFIQVGILGLGAYLVLNREVTLGTIFAISILLGRALAPIDVLVGGWKQLAHARDALRHLNDLYAFAAKTSPGISLPPPHAVISVQSATVTTPSSPRPLLNRVSFRLEPGETLAIVGSSGAGKSTLCKSLVGYTPLSSGEVRIDGAPIGSWKPENLAPHVGYLAQYSEFLPGTIASNIARFEDVDDVAIVEAAQLSGAHQIILNLPRGYHTILEGDGAPLSGGQRQRISLARALFRRPKILVLDEPNANLDGDGEATLLKALDAARSWGATIIVVAHRRNMLRGVDKVLALRDGVIEAFGPAEIVMKQLASPRVARTSGTVDEHRRAKVSPDLPAVSASQ